MNSILPAIEAIAWPIAFWSGLVSTLAAALLSAPAPRPSDRVRRLGVDVFLFAPLYCAGFEILRRADLLTGIAFGTVHAALAIAIALRARHANGPANAARTHTVRSAAARILFGAVLAFLYPIAPP